MRELKSALREYLALRRAMGFKCQHQERALAQFVSFLKKRGSSRITTELALMWATQPARTTPGYQGQRLSFVRGFARHLLAEHPDTQVPPPGLLSMQSRRAKPYLYTREEVQRLMAAAARLSPRNGLPGLSYHCLFGLLAVTGLRIGEALALTHNDVDLKEGVITVRGAKFGKSRVVPVHSSACKMLRRYANRRDALLGEPRSAFFLVAKNGGRIWGPTVRVAFYRISREIGLRAPSDRRGPRLHDLRHRFAVETLIRWCRAGEDIEARLPALSTYLGHCGVRDTYWYLSACPELMSVAVQRLDRRWGSVS